MKYKKIIVAISGSILAFSMTGLAFGAYKLDNVSAAQKISENTKLEIQNYLNEVKNESADLLQNSDSFHNSADLEEVDKRNAEDINEAENTEDKYSPTISSFKEDEAKKVYTEFDLLEKFIEEGNIDENKYAIYVPIVNNSGIKGAAIMEKAVTTNQLEARAMVIPDGNVDVLLDNEIIFENINTFLNDKERQTIKTVFYGDMKLGSMFTIVAYIQLENDEKYVMPIQSNASLFGLEQGKIYDAETFLP